jgi:hypothetical protein
MVQDRSQAPRARGDPGRRGAQASPRAADHLPDWVQLRGRPARRRLALHGAWDATSSIFHGDFVIVGIHLFLTLLGYALLGGAIFKAREIPLVRA